VWNRAATLTLFAAGVATLISVTLPWLSVDQRALMVAPGGDTGAGPAVVAYAIALAAACGFVGLRAWTDDRRQTVALAWLAGVLLAVGVLITWLAAALYVGYDVGTRTTPSTPRTTAWRAPRT
jgi:hypothetical protein